MKPLEGKILVTGAAGLIGSAIVWELNRRGITNILVTDRFSERGLRDERWKNLVGLKFNDYIDGDDFVADIEKAPMSHGEFSAVFHLGACSSTTETDVDYLMRNNFGVTKKLAGWALHRGTRFIYASSAATYGDGSAGMEDGDAKIEALRPLNAYGFSKHLFDLHAKQNGWLHKIAGLKYFNVFGPNEYHKGEMRSLVCKACEQIKATGQMQLFKSHKPEYKDGEQMRDFLYVKDAARMTLHFAEGPGEKAAGLFNLGSGEANTWLELARSIFAAMGLPEKINFVEIPEHIRQKYQYYTKADIGRLRSSGYNEPVTPLKEAVRDYVQGYLVGGKHLGE
jgi:ADP-L-glycero-D-manno-heptose 6-epimerase